MNDKQKKSIIMLNYNKYHIQGCANYIKRPKNAIYIRPGNTIEHETEKLKICHNLQKEGHIFITEACENKTILVDGKEINPIRDVVDLTTGEIYEVETEEERAKRHNTDIIVKMVEVNHDK